MLLVLIGVVALICGLALPPRRWRVVLGAMLGAGLAVQLVLVVDRGSTSFTLLPLLIACAACMALLLGVALRHVYAHRATT